MAAGDVGNARDPDWRGSLRTHLEGQLDRIDDFAEIRWREFSRALRLDQPRQIAAYHGYGSADGIWIRGRLLANEAYGGPRDDDAWWDNLKATYSRWLSHEVPNATVRLRYAGLEQEVETNAEGYYEAYFTRSETEPMTDTVVAEHFADDRTVLDHHWLALPRGDARFVVVSDVDDTVIHTGLTELLKAAQQTFLHNALTRKPLAGSAVLYRSLARGHEQHAVNPVFYLSNSAWNLFDLLRDFLVLNDFPRGPILLRDVGLRSGTEDHKREKLGDLLDRFPHLPFVLIGDSGQHDAEIYADIALKHPDRIRAIFIRDVDPGAVSDYDAAVDDKARSLEQRLSDTGAAVPMVRISDSNAIAEKAVEMGLIPESVLPLVTAAVAGDLER